MNEADLQLSLVYMGAFTDPSNWTIEQHLAGLRAVWKSGADAQKKADAALGRIRAENA